MFLSLREVTTSLDADLGWLMVVVDRSTLFVGWKNQNLDK